MTLCHILPERVGLVNKNCWCKNISRTFIHLDTSELNMRQWYERFTFVLESCLEWRKKVRKRSLCRPINNDHIDQEIFDKTSTPSLGLRRWTWRLLTKSEWVNKLKNEWMNAVLCFTNYSIMVIVQEMIYSLEIEENRLF